jgi:hypothetical protein
METKLYVVNRHRDRWALSADGMIVGRYPSVGSALHRAIEEARSEGRRSSVAVHDASGGAVDAWDSQADPYPPIFCSFSFPPRRRRRRRPAP